MDPENRDHENDAYHRDEAGQPTKCDTGARDKRSGRLDITPDGLHVRFGLVDHLDHNVPSSDIDGEKQDEQHHSRYQAETQADTVYRWDFLW